MEEKDNKCPECEQMMTKQGPDHFHCSCGICVYRGKKLTWFLKKETTLRQYTWPKDPYIKTGGLA